MVSHGSVGEQSFFHFDQGHHDRVDLEFAVRDQLLDAVHMVRVHVRDHQEIEPSLFSDMCNELGDLPVPGRGVLAHGPTVVNVEKSGLGFRCPSPSSVLYICEADPTGVEEALPNGKLVSCVKDGQGSTFLDPEFNLGSQPSTITTAEDNLWSWLTSLLCLGLFAPRLIQKL